MNSMKKTITILLAACTVLQACSYLDISPDLGMDEKEVFSNLANYQAYLETAYFATVKVNNGNALSLKNSTFPYMQDNTGLRFSFDTMTDIADCGRSGLRCIAIKSGTLGDNASLFNYGNFPIWSGCWYINRVANKCIENIGMLEDVELAEVDEVNDILAQAYFLRAWVHMTLCTYYGGVPYIDKSLTADDEWDVAQISPVEVYQRCAKDFKTAYDYFVLCDRVRRDPQPGIAGHLTHPKQDRPNGVAAMALRGRALLYAASPLNNPLGNEQLWKEAADANSEALNLAKEYGYDLLPRNQWNNNFGFVKFTNEQLWAYCMGSSKANGQFLRNTLGYPISNNTDGGGSNPTQNAVDLYETRWGDPLFTEQDRYEAELLGHYNPQDPYANLDSRFYENVIYDGATSEGTNGVINIYYDNATGTYPTTDLGGQTRSFGVIWNKDNRANTTTGYYCRKRWNGKYNGISYYVTDPLIRLAEVYLNYAEAANMAYGPNGGTPGQITALQAVNKIRDRFGMPDVQSRFTSSSESLNGRIQNERTVEFMFEGHHYFVDERRWMIAPERMTATLMGMYIETCEKDSAHPNGKKYIRKPILNQAGWKDEMYYFFLDNEEANKYKNYVNNKAW